jgi:hypothetical protein
MVATLTGSGSGTEGKQPPKATGRNPERDFHGDKRSNATHASTTDPDARLATAYNMVSLPKLLTISYRFGFAFTNPGGGFHATVSSRELPRRNGAGAQIRVISGTVNLNRPGHQRRSERP